MPDLVGGGEAITQHVLEGGDTLLVLSLGFLLRFALGPVSYSAGTPGGLFAPLLTVGAQSGLIFGMICSYWFPGLAPHPMAFAIVGMAAFFTASVRGPVTGIALITEMTASFTLLLPMVAACFAAMVVPAHAAHGADLRFAAGASRTTKGWLGAAAITWAARRRRRDRPRDPFAD